MMIDIPVNEALNLAINKIGGLSLKIDILNDRLDKLYKENERLTNLLLEKQSNALHRKR